jgi:hypothetical protein
MTIMGMSPPQPWEVNPDWRIWDILTLLEPHLKTERPEEKPVQMDKSSSPVRMPIGFGDPAQRKAMEDSANSDRSKYLLIEVYFIAHRIEMQPIGFGRNLL